MLFGCRDRYCSYEREREKSHNHPAKTIKNNTGGVRKTYGRHSKHSVMYTKIISSTLHFLYFCRLGAVKQHVCKYNILLNLVAISPFF